MLLLRQVSSEERSPPLLFGDLRAAVSPLGLPRFAPAPRCITRGQGLFAFELAIYQKSAEVLEVRHKGLRKKCRGDPKLAAALMVVRVSP